MDTYVCLPNSGQQACGRQSVPWCWFGRNVMPHRKEKEQPGKHSVPPRVRGPSRAPGPARGEAPPPSAHLRHRRLSSGSACQGHVGGPDASAPSSPPSGAQTHLHTPPRSRLPSGTTATTDTGVKRGAQADTRPLGGKSRRGERSRRLKDAGGTASVRSKFWTPFWALRVCVFPAFTKAGPVPLTRGPRKVSRPQGPTAYPASAGLGEAATKKGHVSVGLP